RPRVAARPSPGVRGGCSGPALRPFDTDTWRWCRAPRHRAPRHRAPRHRDTSTPRHQVSAAEVSRPRHRDTSTLPTPTPVSRHLGHRDTSDTDTKCRDTWHRHRDTDTKCRDTWHRHRDTKCRHRSVGDTGVTVAVSLVVITPPTTVVR